MNRLNTIAEFFRGNLYSILPVAFIVMITTGYLFFYTSTIGPNLKKRDALISQIADARRALVDAGKRSPSPASPATFADAQATLAASRSILLSDSQASQIIDALYQDANASRVMITDLQTQPVTKSNDQNSVNITTVRLQVLGDSKQLIDFVSRMKETVSKSFQIDNLAISQDKTGTSKLEMDLTLFTSRQ